MRLACIVVIFCFPCLLNMANRSWAQTDYRVVTVVHGGSIRGIVSWSGPQPRLAAFPITKDPAVCDPTSQKTRDLERLIIGSQGGVANTVIFIKTIASGKQFDLPPARRFLDQRLCRYEPHILLVPQHAALQMKSSDATLHTVHMEGAATYNLPFPFQNRTISRDMNTEGLVHLKCNGGHVWMNAEMFVATHPYYAVTDESGEFELTDVPAGTYQLMAWHEGWQIAGQAKGFDVLTEKRVDRPVFSEPKIWQKEITVKEDGSAVVNFVISE